MTILKTTQMGVFITDTKTTENDTTKDESEENNNDSSVDRIIYGLEDTNEEIEKIIGSLKKLYYRDY